MPAAHARPDRERHLPHVLGAAPPAPGRRADDRHPPHVRGGQDSHEGRDRGRRVRLRPRAARRADRRGCLRAAPDRRRPRLPRADPRAGRARQLALRGTRPLLGRGERGRPRALGRDRQARRRPARGPARTPPRRGAAVRRRRLLAAGRRRHRRPAGGDDAPTPSSAAGPSRSRSASRIPAPTPAGWRRRARPSATTPRSSSMPSARSRASRTRFGASA